MLCDVFVASVGLNNSTEYYKLKSTGSDLDRVRLIDTRSAENDWIGADTDPQYRIDASLVSMSRDLWEVVSKLLRKLLGYDTLYVHMRRGFQRFTQTWKHVKSTLLDSSIPNNYFFLESLNLV